MSIFEYDQEEHMRMEREEHYTLGHAQGLEEGRSLGLEEGLSRGHTLGLEEGLSRGHTLGHIDKLVYQISHKIQKHKTIAEIAEELEEPEETVSTLYDMILAHPGSTPKEIAEKTMMLQKQ